MHNKDNWDHLRYVLAVAKSGSVSQAAQNLNVNHATVLRHVTAFETSVGSEIFNKSATGYQVREDRVRIIDAIADVNSAVQNVTQISNGGRAPMHGNVRITSTDSICQVILPPMIKEWKSQKLGLSIELLASNTHLDFSRLPADVAVRPTPKLNGDMVGTEVARLGFCIYHKTGQPTDKWLAPTGGLERSVGAHWMAGNVPANCINGSSDNFLTLREMAANGLGQAILPCFVADQDSRLIRCHENILNLDIALWVATHVDLADVPRIKAVRKLLETSLSAMSDRLAGHGPDD